MWMHVRARNVSGLEGLFVCELNYTGCISTQGRGLRIWQMYVADALGCRPELNCREQDRFDPGDVNG